MDKTWRVLSATGFKNFIEPNNPLVKLVSDYSKNTVNSTAGKLSSTVADLPFEGKAALKKVPTYFSVETLIWGNLQDTAMGRVNGIATNATQNGMSSHFLIRLSDRRLSSGESSAVDGMDSAAP